MKKFNVKNLTVAQRGFFSAMSHKLRGHGAIQQTLKINGKISEDTFRQWCASNGYVVEKTSTTETEMVFNIGRPKQEHAA